MSGGDETVDGLRQGDTRVARLFESSEFAGEAKVDLPEVTAQLGGERIRTTDYQGPFVIRKVDEP